MILQPKKRFQESDAAKFHMELVANPAFHQAIETTLAIMALQIPNGIGAAGEFVSILMNLTDQPKPRIELPKANLNHGA